MPKKKEQQEKPAVAVNVDELTDRLERAANARIEIMKAKVTKERTVDVTFLEYVGEDTVNEVTKKCNDLAHDDLLQAMDSLRVHLALICDLKEAVGLNPNRYAPEAVERLAVGGIVLGGDGDHAGISIIGNKRIGKRVLNLVSPFIKFMDDSDPYKYSGDLTELTEIVVEEVKQYLEGKVAARQAEIDFDGGENGEEVTA